MDRAKISYTVGWVSMQSPGVYIECSCETLDAAMAIARALLDERVTGVKEVCIEPRAVL